MLIDCRCDLGFVEILAEDFPANKHIPMAIEQLQELAGMTSYSARVSLSLGSADGIDSERLHALADLARRVDAPLVSEHIAFVRGGGLESGHLLPMPRTREAVELVVANIQVAKAVLPVPLAAGKYRLAL